MSAPETPTAPPRRLPAAVVKAWLDSSPLGVELAHRLSADVPGAVLTRAGTWMLPPRAADPAVFDRAILLAERVLARLQREVGQGRARALVLPGAVCVHRGTVEPLEDALLAELERRPPPLTADVLHLTGHAAHGLEGRWATARADNLLLGSGRQVPTVVLGPPAPGLPPWRNPELLARSLRWSPRLEPAEELADALTSPAARLTGPLGVGKTRLAWEVLKAAQLATLWRRTTGVASDAPAAPLAAALAAERRRPLWLVFDSLEAADEAAWAEVSEVAERPDLGKGLHLLLLARSGTSWPARLAALPEVRLGALTGEAWDRFCFQVFHGLALPMGVAERLAERAAGSPFALEEALLFLVRDRQLRQVFGSFFFSGTEAKAEFQPSARFRLHAEAEAARLDDPTPVRLLALAGVPVPAEELRAATFAAGAPAPAGDWESRWLEAGLLARREGPWGEGLVHLWPAVEQSLGAALPEPEAGAARRTLGELLAARSVRAEELWGAWPLVAGDDEGTRVLLAAAEAPPSPKLPREALFGALRAEIAAVSERGGDPQLELDLLWTLLPIARSVGRLHELEAAVGRGVTLARGRPERLLAIAQVAAELEQKGGRYREAEATLRKALAAAREADDRSKESLLIELGRVLVRQGRQAEARDLFAKTLQVAERAGRREIVATCRFHLGNLALATHRLDEARAEQQAALELRRQAALGGESAPLSALGAIALADGNYPEALARFREAEAAQARDGGGAESSYVLLGVARTLAGLGDHAAAAPEFRRALALREGRDDVVGEAIARIAVAESHLALGRLEAAHEEARRALFSLSLVAEVDARADAERVLGQVLLLQRRPEEADARFVEAERIQRAAGDDRALLTLLALRLETAIAMGRAPAVESAMAALEAERRLRPEVPSGALFDFHLWKGAAWLRGHGRSGPDPLPFLRRAHEELLRQTGFLQPSLRQRFLFQVSEHAAILEAANRAGLPMPG